MPPTGAHDDDDEQNVGQQHQDEVIGGTPGAAGDDDITARRRARLKELEEKGADASPRAPYDRQEKQPHQFQSGDEVYKFSRQAKQEAEASGGKRKRGVFIGIGVGGGVISIFAGMLSLLPFKLPALMDFVNDYAGQRVEDIVDHEAEKVLLRFMLRGSNAAIANGDVIATGNPLGDLFANLRISRFEDRVLKPRGVTIEPNGHGSIRITRQGTDLGTFKNEKELAEFFNRADVGKFEARKFFKLLVKEDIPTWRWLKRMKYAKLLRLKYMPFFGVGQRKPEESDEDYEKRVRVTEGENINGENAARLGDFIDCVDKPGCNDADKEIDDDMKARANSVSGEAASDTIKHATEEAIQTAAEKAAEDAVQKGITEGVETVTEEAGSKLTTLVGAGSATLGVLAIVDLITTVSNIDHFVANNIHNEKFIRTVAGLRAAAMATFYAFFAGVSSQQEAGELDPVIGGIISDQFNHVSEAASFNAMNSGEIKGEDLSVWQKPNGNIANNEWIKTLDAMYSSTLVTWTLRAPLIGWYYTIGWVWNHIGQAIGSGIGWVIDHVCLPTACPKELLAEFTKLVVPLWNWVSQFFGLSFDALMSDANAFNVLAYGAQAGYDSYCMSIDCHELTGAAARESAQRIARENAEYNSDKPFLERMFSLDNTASLASALVRTMPSLSPTAGGVGSLAFAGFSLAGSLPGNLVNLASGRAHAAGGDISLDAMMGNADVGIDDSELDLPLSPTVLSGGTCTVNNDSHFDNCAADMAVIDSMNCSISVVSLCPDAAPPTGDNSAINPTVVLPEGTAAKLAQLILADPNITFEGNPPNYPGDGAHSDFVTVAAGHQITTCGTPNTISVPLMQALLAAAGNYTDPNTGKLVPSHYKFRINALESDHDCSSGFHPKGEAADLGLVNGVVAGPSSNPNDPNAPCAPGCGLQTDTYKQFATFIGKVLPATGRIGQAQCLGKLDIPPSIIQHNDVCHHLHIASGE